MTTIERANQRTVDIGQVLDDGPFTALQKVVVVVGSLSLVLDGFDGQMIGYAIPDLMREWGVSRGAFAPAVAAGLVGMALGSAAAGVFADKFGRRMALIVSVLLFGAATCTIGLATNIPGIAALRFIAGLGIGGAMPIATTITSEFTPARSRTIAITATCICVPLGGMLAGVFASIGLPLYGWRSLFFIGGTLPLACGMLLLRVLPETPRFLARKNHRWPELRKLLSRMDKPTEEGTVFLDSREQTTEKRAGYGALFDMSLIRDTLAIWIAFFMCLLAVYSAFSWLPTMLAAEGLPSGIGGAGLTAYNFGAAIGGLGCAIAITRFGSRWPMALAAGGAAASAFLLQGVNVGKYTSLFIFGLGVHGMLVSAIQCTLYAVCAHVYTTSVRATGTASALAFGRIGSILSAFLGAMVITAGGASAYLGLLGSAMLCVTVALLLIKRHIPSPKEKRLLNSELVV